MVEAQHLVSTQKITDTADEQKLIEELIEESKPAVPPECRELHYLLSTPFRYPPHPFGSRFRHANDSRGVFYASEAPETALAEMVFYRLLFFAESPRTPWPSNPGQFTAFAAQIETDRGLDLTQPPLNAHRDYWTLLTDYSYCRDLAETARAAECDIIRYQSVRDPLRGLNLAVLRCRAFAANDPMGFETWRIHFNASGVRARCEFPPKEIAFARDAFAADPRLSGFKWER
jgi:hypothetical protein